MSEELREAFRATLEGAGWRPADEPGLPWIDHVLVTGSARLQVLYIEDPPPVGLDLELELHDGPVSFDTYLAMRPGDQGRAIVEAIAAAAPTLDVATWPALYDRLVTLAERVSRVDGVGGEDTWVAGPGDHAKVLDEY